jgi:hypothetical protein
MVMPDEGDIQRDLLRTYHDALTAGHPGVTWTLKVLSGDYWWPGMRRFIRAYIKGCAKCQESKTITHLNKPPLQPITPRAQARPFSTIAMDFIMKLPDSKGYDSILTITDHDCTKAVILLPC